jgi:3-isopropylmalate dehydrogenase
VIDAVVMGMTANRWRSRRVLGIIPGEGIGAEVIRAASDVLDALESVASLQIERLTDSNADPVPALGPGESGSMTPATEAFCREVFEHGGVLLCGPMGGRFVYDIRRRFDLFCKLAPLKPLPQLHAVSRLKPEILRSVDMVVVRDNAGGIYQGRWAERIESRQGRLAEHWFSYSQSQVERIVAVGVRLAKSRRGRMHVVVKEGGIPAISALWREVALQVADGSGVECILLNADYAAYRLIQCPGEFDVLVTPNMVGDLLVDLGAVFLGSRGMSYTGNFSAGGAAAYQTGHGAARNLAATDRANPLAQILSLAMLLQESFGLTVEAALVESAIGDVLNAGWRTDDLAQPGCRCVGTRQMGELVAQSVVKLAGSRVLA